MAIKKKLSYSVFKKCVHFMYVFFPIVCGYCTNGAFSGYFCFSATINLYREDIIGMFSLRLKICPSTTIDRYIYKVNIKVLHLFPAFKFTFRIWKRIIQYKWLNFRAREKNTCLSLIKLKNMLSSILIAGTV